MCSVQTGSGQQGPGSCVVTVYPSFTPTQDALVVETYLLD
jgi:hypothetical protein